MSGLENTSGPYHGGGTGRLGSGALLGGVFCIHTSTALGVAAAGTADSSTPAITVMSATSNCPRRRNNRLICGSLLMVVEPRPGSAPPVVNGLSALPQRTAGWPFSAQLRVVT